MICLIMFFQWDVRVYQYGYDIDCIESALEVGKVVKFI